MIRNVKASRAPIKVASENYAMRVIEALPNYQDKIMVLTMFETGMRIGELVNLQVENIYGDSISIQGKGGKIRSIPMSNHMKLLLFEYMNKNHIRTGLIFTTDMRPNTNPIGRITPDTFRKRLSRYLGPQGLYINPHAFRHGIATILMQNGMDIRTLQTFLGHSDIRTTMFYTHVSDEHLKESYLKNAPVLSSIYNKMC
jgi:integrase/recombinase XerD